MTGRCWSLHQLARGKKKKAPRGFEPRSHKGRGMQQMARSRVVNPQNNHYLIAPFRVVAQAKLRYNKACFTASQMRFTQARASQDTPRPAKPVPSQRRVHAPHVGASVRGRIAEGALEAALSPRQTERGPRSVRSLLYRMLARFPVPSGYETSYQRTVRHAPLDQHG